MADRTDEMWQQHAENKLWEMIEGVEVVQEKLDKDGCVHELHAKLPPNVDAIKFALKNRSKGKWADKTEVTHTQVNVNLTASYDEVKKLLEKEKQKSIAKLSDNIISLDDEEVIEGEVVNADSDAN